MSRQRRHVEDEEMDFDFSQTQSQKVSMPPQERVRLCGILCNFMLTSSSKKVTVKRSDLRKLIPKQYGRVLDVLLSDVNEKLTDIYAYSLVCITKGCYILKNDLEAHLPEDESRFIVPVNDSSTYALLLLILTTIFMAGGTIQQDVLKDYLSKHDVHLDRKMLHSAFGNVDALIHHDFVKQCYLDVVLNKDSDPPVKEYRWGKRAEIEVSKKELLEFFCKIHGENMLPQHWPQLLKEATEEPAGSAEHSVAGSQ